MKFSKLTISAALTLVFVAAGSANARTPVNDNYNEDAPYCREYTQTFSIGGEKETGYGTACLQPDGSWQIVSQDDKDESDINYIVKEEKIYVEPREVIFAPGHYWHRRPTAFISISHGRHYPHYHHRHRHHHHRHHRRHH
jgi:hypothetical protein